MVLSNIRIKDPLHPWISMYKCNIMCIVMCVVDFLSRDVIIVNGFLLQLYKDVKETKRDKKE